MLTCISSNGRWSTAFKLALVILVFLCWTSPTNSQLTFELHNETQSLTAVQLWYNGYWKHPGWINGTLVTEDAKEKNGKVVAVVNAVAPYDSFILDQVRAGAVAVVFIRDRSGVPGQTMYVVDGSDQLGLTIPVVEVFQVVSDAKYPLSKSIPREGLAITLWPEENAWKVANDKSGFQVTMNLFICIWAVGIIGIGMLRLNQWWSGTGWKFITIGTVCIMLELVSAALRIALCIVDPFWSFRMMPDPAQNIFITVNLPFTFAAGILLTFFWAETLKSQRIRASPFISEYRKSAIVVIIVLFVAEITTAIVRWKLASYSSFNPTWITQALYVITSLVLTVCYIICAFKIREKLREIGGHKKTKIRNMTLRFVGSTLGYLSFTVFLIALIPCLNYPWPFKLLLNGVAIASNWWSTLQVYSFKPPRRRSGTSHSSHGTGDGTSPSLKSQKSDFSLSARPRKRADEATIDSDTTDDENTNIDIEKGMGSDGIVGGETPNTGEFTQNGNWIGEISQKDGGASNGPWNAAILPSNIDNKLHIDPKAEYNEANGADAQDAMEAAGLDNAQPSPNTGASPPITALKKILIPTIIKRQSRGLTGANGSPKQVSFSTLTPQSPDTRTTTSLVSSGSSSSSEASLLGHSPKRSDSSDSS